MREGRLSGRRGPRDAGLRHHHVPVLLGDGHAAVGHLPHHGHHLLGRERRRSPGQLPRARVQGRRVPHQQHVAAAASADGLVLGRLEDALRHEEVPRVVVLGRLSQRVLQLLGRDVGLVVELDVVPGGEQLLGAHPVGDAVHVPHEPLKEPRLHVDLQLVLQTQPDQNVVARLHAPERRRGVDVREGDLLPPEPLADHTRLRYPHPRQGTVEGESLRTGRAARHVGGHVEVLLRVVALLVEAERDPRAEGEVNAFSVARHEDSTGMLRVQWLVWRRRTDEAARDGAGEGGRGSGPGRGARSLVKMQLLLT